MAVRIEQRAAKLGQTAALRDIAVRHAQSVRGLGERQRGAGLCGRSRVAAVAVVYGRASARLALHGDAAAVGALGQRSDRRRSAAVARLRRGLA